MPVHKEDIAAGAVNRSERTVPGGARRRRTHRDARLEIVGAETVSSVNFPGGFGNTGQLHRLISGGKHPAGILVDPVSENGPAGVWGTDIVVDGNTVIVEPISKRLFFSCK